MKSNPTVTEGAADQASFLELWQVLVDRKWLVFAFLVVCMVAAAAYLLLQQPSYQASVGVRIGQVAGAGQIEVPEVLASRLMGEYGEDVAAGIKREPPFLKRASAMRTVPGAIELVVQGYRPEGAAELLRRIYAEIQTSHNDAYDKNLSLVTERLDNLRQERVSLKGQYADATVLVDRLKQGDPVQAALIALERGRITAAILTLDSEILALGQKLTAPQTQPTQLLGSITAPAAPFSPRRALILLLAAILGIAGGVLLALGVEFLARTRRVFDARST